MNLYTYTLVMPNGRTRAVSIDARSRREGDFMIRRDYGAYVDIVACKATKAPTWAERMAVDLAARRAPIAEAFEAYRVALAAWKASPTDANGEAETKACAALVAVKKADPDAAFNFAREISSVAAD